MCAAERRSAPEPPQDRQALRRAQSEDIDDTDDESVVDNVREKAPIVPLDEPEVDFGLTPMVAEDPRKCFERYIHRLSEGAMATSECSWEALQTRAAEHLQGGHLGKLEFFWILRPGAKASPEAADGLACFQFVQSYSCNFARILHLSVVDGPAGGWRETLPSAVLEVRRMVFGSLPVDSLRSVVLAAEDESARIYIDRNVETAFKRCGFRWFQLTQTLTRKSGSVFHKGKRLTHRFLVMHAYRQGTDPCAPQSSIGRLSPLLLKDDMKASSASSGAAEHQEEDGSTIGFAAF